ncbi:hypothetical protein ACFSTC_33725 [Nonomuraea ferruginea]
MTAGIVGVHGIGKYDYYLRAGGSAAGAATAMREKWDRYLHASLGGPARTYFSEVAYFSHLLRDPATTRAAPLLAARRDAAGWAGNLGFGEYVTGTLRSFTAWVLSRLEGRSAAFAELFAPEVAAYLTDQGRRERVRGRSPTPSAATGPGWSSPTLSAASSRTRPSGRIPTWRRTCSSRWAVRSACAR